MEPIGNSISMMLPGQIAAASNGESPSLEQMKELGTEFESVFLSNRIINSNIRSIVSTYIFLCSRST